MNEKQIQEVMALVDNYAQAAYGLCGASASPQKLSECRAAIESALREQVRGVPDGWKPTQPAQPPEDLTRKCLPHGLRYKLPPLELTGHQVVQFAEMARAADSLDATWRLKELEPLSAYDKDGPCPGGVAVTTDGQPGYALLPTQPAQAEQTKVAAGLALDSGEFLPASELHAPEPSDYDLWVADGSPVPVEQPKAGWVLIATDAYEAGFGKGLQAAETGKEIANPWGDEPGREAWSLGYAMGKERYQPKAAQQERADGGAVFCWLVEEFGPSGNSTGRYMLDQGELTITPDVHAARKFKGMRTAMFRADDMREKHGGDWRHAQHGFAAAPQREPKEYKPPSDMDISQRTGYRKGWIDCQAAHGITKKEQQ